MTLTQLEYVLAVDRYRHFGKAAQSCFVTQPTLSMQLQKLEEELQVVLFDRSKNPILPTQEGIALINQAQIVVREHKRIFDLVQKGKNEMAGSFKLAVIPTLSPYVIPLFAQNFVQKYPHVNLIIEEAKTDDILVMLEKDEIDAGLLVTPLHNDALIERVLYYEPFYLFVSPNHPFSKKTKVKQDDLDINEIWLLNKGNCFRDQVINICSEKNSRDSNVGSIRFESGNFETLKNMVLKSDGYTLLPYLAVQELSSSKKKLVKDFHNPIPTREISLVYGRSFLKEKIIDALEAEILTAIPKELKSYKNKNVDVVEIFQSDI